MNKKQVEEFMRLDMKIDEKYDKIRNNKNQQWRLNNEILRLGQENGREDKKIIELKKQQYRLKGRIFIELDGEKKKELQDTVTKRK